MRLLYQVDDCDPCTLEELLAANEDTWDGDEIDRLCAMQPGDVLHGGGGAAAEYSIRAVPEPTDELIARFWEGQMLLAGETAALFEFRDQDYGDGAQVEQ